MIVPSVSRLALTDTHREIVASLRALAAYDIGGITLTSRRLDLLVKVPVTINGRTLYDYIVVGGGSCTHVSPSYVYEGDALAWTCGACEEVRLAETRARNLAERLRDLVHEPHAAGQPVAMQPPIAS